ncbi:MAG: hypothetical protein ACE15C_11555 [Phycisphaerae bacterium]
MQITPLAAPSSARAQQVIEGFETIESVRAVDGKLTVVRGGEGVTEGAQAAQMPSGAGIAMTLSGADLRKWAWLKIDTLTLQPLPHVLNLRFAGPRLLTSIAVCAQPGKDTVALPLPAWTSENPEAWGDEKIELALANAGDVGIILDNIRYEEADKAPAGAAMVDFGPRTRASWPGFGAAGEVNNLVAWGHNQVLSEGNANVDPLVRSFTGPIWYGKWPDSFDLTVDPARPSVAWLWVTHYRRNGTANEYGLVFKGKPLLGKRFSAAQMLGPDGIGAGKDGAWTPQWFDATYAGHFYDIVQVELDPGKNRFDVVNCQLAALVAAPKPAQKAMADYVDKVIRKDISRFRRQFIVGARVDVACTVAPTPAETRAGIMAFAPPSDQAFGATYRPADLDRAGSLRASLLNGGTAVIPFAVSPVGNITGLSMSVAVPKDLAGRPVAPADVIETWFINRVPRILDARVQFQPWLLTHTVRSAGAKEVVHAAVIVRVSPGAASGVYRGSLSVRHTSGQVQLPLEITVLNTGEDDSAQGIFGTLTGTNAGGLYAAAVDAMTQAQQDELSARIRRELLKTGVDTMLLPGPGFQAPATVTDGGYGQFLKSVPGEMLHGPAFFEGYAFLRDLAGSQVLPGTQRYRETIAAMVRKMSDVAVRNKLQGYYLYLWWVLNPAELPNYSRQAAEIAAAGGKPCGAGHVSVLSGIAPDVFKNQLAPFSATVIVPDGKDTAGVIAKVKGLGKDHQAFVWQLGADRYGVGFFAAACGADGAIVEKAEMDYGPYMGFQTSTAGLLAPEDRDRALSPTLAALLLQQGEDDYRLYRRARELAIKARAAKVDSTELEKLLADIRTTANAQGASDYNPNLLRTTAIGPAKMEEWRSALLARCTAVISQMKKN